MSISTAAISFTFDAGTLSPLTFTIPRPLTIRRLKTTRSSSGYTSSSARAAVCRLSFTEKTSSANAGSCPPAVFSRSISFCTFPPSARLMEPMIIDLPAPVSPERIFSPRQKVTSDSSISARFFTCRLSNINPPVAQLFSDAP